MKLFFELSRKYWLIVLIVLLAAFFRVNNINTVPPNASLDEVSIGWNAYSILKTGRDEYKVFLPFVLRAYDDFRPALYVYLVIPFVALLGLTTTAVRLPSVLLSIISVYCTFLLTNLIVEKNSRKLTLGSLTLTPGHIAAFLLAISPWHIYISRLGHEVNAGLGFLIIGCTFFFSALEYKKPRLFLLATFFWALSFASYQSEKIVIPLFVGVIGILFFPKLKLTKSVYIAIAIGILMAIPTVITTLNSNGLMRLSGTSAFTEGNPLYEQDRLQYMASNQKKDIMGRIIYNPKLTSSKIFISNYFSHFSPQWLFTGGAFNQHKVPYTGLLYWWELPFILLGLVLILLKPSRFSFVILAWLLIAPLPAAITTQAPHALRSFTFLPSWQILESIGIIFVLFHISRWERIVVCIILSGIGLVLATQMYMRYLVVFPQTQSEAFGYALNDALIYVKNNYAKNTPITLTDSIRIDKDMVGENHMVVGDFETYMFYLFAMNYDPYTYQKAGGTPSGGLGRDFSFNNTRISKFQGMILETGRVYIGSKKDFPAGMNIRYRAKFLDGAPGVYVGEKSL